MDYYLVNKTISFNSDTKMSSNRGIHFNFLRREKKVILVVTFAPPRFFFRLVKITEDLHTAIMHGFGFEFFC